MERLSRIHSSVRPILAAAALAIVACTGTIVPPTRPTPPPVTGTSSDMPCPTGIPDQDPNICPRLKNINVTCGGNGMLHTSVGGGSGSPIVLGAKLDDESVLSAVFVVVACKDGPREGITLGVTYTGQVAQPETGPPCIAKSKAVYSQFRFGDPAYAPFEGLAKDKLFNVLDDQAIGSYASFLGLTAPATSRCSLWRPLP